MSTKENNDVVIDKATENDKASDAKCDLKGIKRAAEVCFFQHNSTHHHL